MSRRPRHYYLKTPWYKRGYIKKPRYPKSPTEYGVETSSLDELLISGDRFGDNNNAELQANMNIQNQRPNLNTTHEEPLPKEIHSELELNDSMTDSSSCFKVTTEDESEIPENSMIGDYMAESNNSYSKQEPSDSYTDFAKFRDDIVIRDIIFMMLNFYIRHKLTQEGLEDLMRMLNVLTIGKIFPECFSTISNVFPASYDAERAYFCVNCQFGYINPFILIIYHTNIYFLYLAMTLHHNLKLCVQWKTVDLPKRIFSSLSPLSSRSGKVS
ncbi:uncharacterized protein LOC134227716 [Armigeres subalbatus]|uniref:uncharacterized protein LOC134227716 n=1 Tax=Armigeres subalbatus TaxID=124917 RepID=UPI002ED230EA